jgi:prepilin-type N-terminal cleavage/methylation domain-containing protein
MIGAKLRRHHTYGGDDGFTLVELMVAMIVFSMLLVMTTPVITTFLNVDSNITNTVGTVGSILPATSTLQRYIRSAVSPAPSNPPPFASIGAPPAAGYPAGTPNPTLYQVGSNQMSFYSNVGDLDANGNPIGPRLVTLTTSGPLPRTGYTVTLSSQKSVVGSCPGSNALTMSQATNAACSYVNQPATLDFSINYVTNGSQTDPNPIFQYIAGITSTGLPNVVVPGSAPAGWNCSASTCVPATAAAIATVTGVQIDVESKQTVGSLTSFRTTVLFFANGYSANVG